MAGTLAITSIALFTVVLDNLVVSTTLPVIRVKLGASLEQLEWTVNGYTLPFAVLLITGAALGDRFGRRRIFSLRWTDDDAVHLTGYALWNSSARRSCSQDRHDGRWHVDLTAEPGPRTRSTPISASSSPSSST